MIPKKDIIEIYKKHFPARARDVSVEKNIIKYILLLENEDMSPEYLSLYSGKMNSSTIKADNSIIIFDELLQYTIMSFYLMIFSLACNNSNENFQRCFKNCVVLLDLQGNKNEIGTHNLKEMFEMCKLPKSILDLAMDAYWVSWTFVFAHEFYHAKCTGKTSPLQEEVDADKSAYMILLHLIMAQKNAKIPDDMKVFHEYLYLAPLMLMEYFKLLDFYNSLFGKAIDYTDHPTPEIRQEKLFDMFDDYIPESFDTTIGNDLYNSFLDQIDVLKEQLEIKKKNGKLDFLSNI